MKAAGTLIKIDGSRSQVESARDEKEGFMLEELQGYVGGYIEIVRIANGEILVINEEGAINGMKLNAVASLLCGQMIFGDVLRTKDEYVK